MTDKKSKILIFGKFDILHPGHIKLIKEAQTAGETVVVLESDQAVFRYGKFLPYYNQIIREKNLKNYGLKVYLRKDQDYQQVIDELKPDILYLGYDQKHLLQNYKILEKRKSNNFKIKIIPAYHPELFKSSRLRSILEDTKASVYLLDKPIGTHSFKAVSKLRQLLNIKKIGFAGTLDPLASGLLILSASKATRLLDWFHFLPKTYVAEIVFGQVSDTYDREGEIVENKKAQKFSREKLSAKIKEFIGPQEQTVPVYSAKKVKGKKLHELARKGQIVEPPKTNIEIYSIKIKNFSYPKASLEVTCSAGTYIRSLASDLGKNLGTGAILSNLRRTDIGKFSVSQALELENLSQKDLLSNFILPLQAIDSLNAFFYQEKTD